MCKRDKKLEEQRHIEEEREKLVSVSPLGRPTPGQPGEMWQNFKKAEKRQRSRKFLWDLLMSAITYILFVLYVCLLFWAWRFCAPSCPHDPIHGLVYGTLVFCVWAPLCLFILERVFGMNKQKTKIITLVAMILVGLIFGWLKYHGFQEHVVGVVWALSLLFGCMDMPIYAYWLHFKK